MLQIEYTNQFKRDLKLAEKRGKNIDLLINVIAKLQNQEP